MAWQKEPHVKLLYTEYYVRRMNAKRLQIAKFVNGSEAPKDTYTLDLTAQGWLCDCFGGVIHNKYNCKHVPLVTEFLQVEQQVPWEELYPCCFMERHI